MITADPREGTMADVWVLSPSHSEPEKSRLIRSDAITYLSTSAEELVAARVGSDDTVVWFTGPPRAAETSPTTSTLPTWPSSQWPAGGPA
ncbi:hypothetical protein AS594_35475 [Streptomyces agglomeratus]|uniref:Uncharacterized protein n=1 Tax=Streptomyces agglomeratus TaxID=285458 RepID=A0A1E5PHA0_9ACTN|nr:hypothetical protein [Streptomyces agglomeratus]OEJ28938.1 hypothetical protein AS594_35475 [Streptomyces agglomeratus]